MFDVGRILVRPALATGTSGHQNDPGLRLRTLRPSRSICSQELSATSTEAAHFFAFRSASGMLAASMEAPSYGASRLPFTIRHRPTLYVTKFASCGWVSISWRQRGGRGDPAPAPTR